MDCTKTFHNFVKIDSYNGNAVFFEKLLAARISGRHDNQSRLDSYEVNCKGLFGFRLRRTL